MVDMYVSSLKNYYAKSVVSKRSAKVRVFFKLSNKVSFIFKKSVQKQLSCAKGFFECMFSFFRQGKAVGNYK